MQQTTTVRVRPVSTTWSPDWRVHCSRLQSTNRPHGNSYLAHRPRVRKRVADVVLPLVLCSALALSAPSAALSATIADLTSANLMVGSLISGSFGSEDAFTDAFTLYGKTLKKYFIETVENGRIVGRKKGFTAQTCVGVEPEFLETPQFRGLAPSEKAAYAQYRECVEATGRELQETCRVACDASCTKAVATYATGATEERGLGIGEKLRATLTRKCVRQCNYECRKPGKISDFYVPSRK